MAKSTILVAGATGDLGGRITRALAEHGATVHALLRHDASATDRDRVRALGAEVVLADVSDVSSVAAVCGGVDCVVSALNTVPKVILEQQSVLLDAAVAGFPRFICSDYSADFTNTRPVLRVAGDSLSVRDPARTLTHTVGQGYRPLRAGSLIGLVSMLAPERDAVFPAWQGMQHTRDTFAGRVRVGPLDNDRFAEVTFTSVHGRFSGSLPTPAK